jgi:hypothetical protein
MSTRTPQPAGTDPPDPGRFVVPIEELEISYPFTPEQVEQMARELDAQFPRAAIEAACDESKHPSDWRALRAQTEAGRSPEWVARYGEASWEAALIAFGELSPAALASMGPAERQLYALAPKPTGSGG